MLASRVRIVITSTFLPEECAYYVESIKGLRTSALIPRYHTSQYKFSNTISRYSSTNIRPLYFHCNLESKSTYYICLRRSQFHNHHNYRIHHIPYISHSSKHPNLQIPQNGSNIPHIHLPSPRRRISILPFLHRFGT